MNVAGEEAGFDGDAQNGYNCLMCGAHVKYRRTARHRDWHAERGEKLA